MIEQVVLVILALLGIALVLGLPVLLLVLLLLAYWRSARVGALEQRLAALEKAVRVGAAPAAPPSEPVLAEMPVAVPVDGPPPIITPPPAAEPVAPAKPRPTTPSWELIVGRSALGWVALASFVLAAATFLKYAFDNAWIGPQGQLSLIVLAALIVLFFGFRHAEAGWRVLAEIFLAAGMVVLYLAAYGSFGWYHVLPQSIGSIFLIVLVTEAALIAYVYRAWSVAFVAILGGLATPVLIAAPTDNYAGFFTYLFVLNAAAFTLIRFRRWPVLGTLAMLGAQALVVGWYETSFHPAKLPWAAGFELALWLLVAGYHVTAFVTGDEEAGIEDLVRLPLAGLTCFSLLFRMFIWDWEPWLGTAALVFAMLHLALAWISLVRKPDRPVLVSLPLGLAAAFCATALALEGGAEWTALGWAVLGAALWWLGLRIVRWELRAMAAVFLAAAVLRWLSHESLRPAAWGHWPILNETTLPALGIVACILWSASLTWQGRCRIGHAERALVVIAGIGGAFMLGLVVSLDLRRWVSSRGSEAYWFHAADATVSVWWAFYATVLLAIGFRRDRPMARWLALGLYGLTGLKVFFHDLAHVGDLFRVLALFVFALVLAGAAWAYQRWSAQTAAAPAPPLETSP